tara:strand:- start:473 stop:1798 length:1326 start_codon:yes stop_codon:yes gene_type:complete
LFKVFYKYSACIKICTDDASILCDPWFGQSAYDGTWGQYPKTNDVENLVGEFDIVYISHIHPDHYCPESLNLLFKKFGKKKIIIADWGKGKSNYLERKIRSDGFGDLLIISNNETINDTEINIIPNDTNSISDIDTALIVSSKRTRKAVLNINDCIYNQSHFNHIIKLKNKLKIEFNLFCLGYTGAGPYPQTYYSPETQVEVLIEKSNAKKNSFFERYKKAIQEIPSLKRLPFAGKYILKGDLSRLNKYRGVADALEVKDFDQDAIILDDGGDAFFDVENICASRERKEFYNYPETIKSQKDYFWRTSLSFTPSKSLLKRLLFQSLKRAHSKSECTSNLLYSIYPYDDPKEINEIWSTNKPYEKTTPIITFNCKKDCNPLKDIEESVIHSHIFIESKALFAVLTGVTHWNNYEVGSVFQVRRVPDKYDGKMQTFLNFFSVI